MYRTDLWTLWEKARVGWSERTASKHVYYQVWNRSPAQVGCMRQVLGAGALGWPRGMGWGARWEGGSGWGAHVNPWLIHVNVWQKPLQYCKVISLQLIKINEKKKSLLQHHKLMPQFEGINSLALSLLYGPAFTTVHDYWKIMLLLIIMATWNSPCWRFKRRLFLASMDHHLQTTLCSSEGKHSIGKEVIWVSVTTSGPILDIRQLT